MDRNTGQSKTSISGTTIERRSRLIGICGKAQSGKSTIRKYLESNYGFISRPMASPLKEMLKSAFNFTDDQVYGDKKEISDPRWFNVTPRKALQFVGTDLFRNQMSMIMPELGSQFWIHSFKIWYSIHGQNNDVVVDDIRFEDEINMIHELGGEIMIIKRSNYNIMEIHTHASEALDLEKIETHRWKITNMMNNQLFDDVDHIMKIWDSEHHYFTS